MTPAEFGTYLAFAAGFCLVLTIVNVFRARYFLSLACLSLAAAIVLYRSQAGESVVIVAGLGVGLFLALDVGLRLRRKSSQEPNK